MSLTCLRYRELETSTGTFLLLDDETGTPLTAWRDHLSEEQLADARSAPRLWPELAARLRAFFDGDRVTFEDVPLAAGTPFQQACWRACRRIRYGRLSSYGALARAAGRPQAARAVGQAMRSNPQPIITPCHRVVAADGRLHGFAGSLLADDRTRCKASLIGMERSPTSV